MDEQLKEPESGLFFVRKEDLEKIKDGYYWKLRVKKEYDPSQPRVPAGSPEGGRWTANAFGLVLPKDITREEFVGSELWRRRGLKSDVPVYVRETDLPPVEPGKTRFYHGTQSYNAQSISKQGILTGEESGLGERLRVILGVVGKQSGFGDINIVADLPEADVHKINDEWAEVARAIRLDEIRGILLTRMSGKAEEVIPIYKDWMARGGALD